METIKEVIERFEGYGKKWVDIEVYVPKFGNDDTNAYYFKTDYIEGVEGWSENVPVINADCMSEEDYAGSILSNSCVTADFEEWYDDKNAKVLCILIEKN